MESSSISRRATLPPLLAAIYLVTGPSALCFCVMVLFDRIGAPSNEALPDIVDLAGLLFAYLVAGAGGVTAILAVTAAILMRRHGRQTMPLWLLAVIACLGWISVYAVPDAEGQRLLRFIKPLIFLYGPIATWIVCSDLLSSLLARRTPPSS